MTHTPDNPPAFPFSVDMGNGTVATHHGLSLRDYFAGQALAGLAHDVSIRQIGAVAYEYADAMLAARKGGAE